MRRLPALVLAFLAGLTPTAHGEESLRDKGRSHWAFQPVSRPAVPAVRDRAWPRTPVDAFLLARLEAAGLRPSAPTDRRTLLRRVTLALTGLPPAPEEVEAFLADRRPGAYERVVDRLLASPAYGERWGRHWLDVARYADTNGYERDGDKPHAWRYRDYVIDAFNRDLPYDRFVKEQIAGDELPDTDARAQIATTFLRLGTWDDEPANAAVDRFDQLDDVLGTTTAAFLAQTVRCARCHDHFLEPFSQKEYYRLLAVFQPLRRPQKGRTDLDLPVGSAAEVAAHAKLIDQTVGQLFRAVQGKVTLPAIPTALAAPRAYIWYEDGPRAPETRLLRRGNPNLTGPALDPGLPALLAPKPPPPPRALSNSTGRRLWLANWVASRQSPLTARVIVNRLWQHHFGRGLVGTPNDFGLQGERPSHPKLLDWLADELVEAGWSLKHLHRLIVTSAAYRTSSAHDGPDAPSKLPLFGRWRQRRLEAEALRDSVLALSGQLNLQMAGPGVKPPLPKSVLATQSRPGLGWRPSNEVQSARRSVYVFAKRSLALPELELLDAPDSTSSCEQRPLSTTAPQAMVYLNGDFTARQAELFADRLRREAGDDRARQARRAFLLALSRPPSADELKLVLAFLDRQERLIAQDDNDATRRPADARRRALAAFCLVLINSNEFFHPG